MSDEYEGLDTSVYPTTREVRDWAVARGCSVPGRGKLPWFVVDGWNKAYPERPYVAAQAFHGTPSGYNDRFCRCDLCRAAIAAVRRAQREDGR